MTGLVLKLAPKERVLINGAVIENGERRSNILILSPQAKILRLRDALHPEEINTPVRRVCYTIQLVLSGDLSAEVAYRRTLQDIEQLSQIFRDPDSRRLLAQASQALIAEQQYQALKHLRALLPREARLMAAVTA